MFMALASFIWMGAIFLMSFSFFMADISLLLFEKFSFSSKIPIFSVFLWIAILLKALYNGFSPASIKKIHLDSGFGINSRIAFLSDIHADFPFRKKLFFDSLQKVLMEKPDFIVIGGDLVDPGFEMSEEEFKRLSSTPVGKIAVFGNHEYYYGVDKSAEIFKKSGFILLRNSAIQLKGINFIGFSDIKTEKIDKEKAIEILNSLYKKKMPNILISHQPLYFDELSKDKNLLMLSGHIHKAQIFPFHIFVRPFYHYFYGLYRKDSSFLYVSSGSGTWGPPMRFFAKPEALVIEFN